MRKFSTILALIGVVSVLALTGCLSSDEEFGERGGSESAEHSGSESGEGGERSGEQDGSESGEGGEGSGEHSGSESGEGGEGSGEHSGSESGEGGEGSGEHSGSESGEGGEKSGEHSGSESGEGDERAGEHSGSESSEGGERSGEHSGSESGESGEESGTQFGLNETFDEVRAGARLVLSYDPDANAFIGTVENTTGAALSRVRVEVHLSNGTELGPTTPIDLEPGQVVDVNLPATNRPFTSWSAHPEVG